MTWGKPPRWLGTIAAWRCDLTSGGTGSVDPIRRNGCF